jgi:thymidylate synthase
MKIIKEKTLSEAYSTLVSELLIDGETQANTVELTNTIIEIEKPSLKNIHFALRKISKNYLRTELKWYWEGRNDVKSIGDAAKMWYDISDDGETSNSAYGYIIQLKHNKNQLNEVLKVLQKDPSSRKAVLSIIDPTLNKLETKDLQCTIAIQFLIRKNKLHMTVFMRSNDIYFGFPYDSIYFITLQEWLAKNLNIDVGSYTHHATSMHVYKRDIPSLKEHSQSISVNENLEVV